MRAPLVIPLCLTGLVACASLPAAEMAQPRALEDAVIQQATGIGSGRTGDFAAGAWRGSFVRSDERLSVFEPAFEQRGGAVRFDLTGPNLNGQITADCHVRERSVGAAFVTVAIEPMVYRCTFQHEGRTLPARFEVRAASREPDSLIARRTGEIAFDRAIVQIRSVHRIQGARLPSATPTGYEFLRDEAPIGSVALNGDPRNRMAASATVDERRAMLIASIALGLVWDPADSALGRDAR
jgi:hypothetical protein